jgi:FkbM family methyltransferase
MTGRSAKFGALQPGRLDSGLIGLTSALPPTRLGLRLAILLRKLVTLRLAAGALDVTRWGLNVRLHPLDNGCEKNLLFTPQMYEPDELAALAGEIARGPSTGAPFVFIDIGANVGLFSLFVAARAGQNARIIAIEPEPGNFERLRFNVASNKALPIEPIATALGNETGEVAIALNSHDRGGTRVQALTEANPQTTVRVSCRPLLSLLQEREIATIDALKIDVEGMEDKVLAPFFRDAPATMWPRMILIEDSSHEWKIDLFAVLKEKGYAVSLRTKQNVVLRRA